MPAVVFPVAAFLDSRFFAAESSHPRMLPCPPFSRTRDGESPPARKRSGIKKRRYALHTFSCDTTTNTMAGNGRCRKIRLSFPLHAILIWRLRFYRCCIHPGTIRLPMNIFVELRFVRSGFRQRRTSLKTLRSFHRKSGHGHWGHSGHNRIVLSLPVC